ncbi:voltage-dependent calcium channel subunit alpha-2/delta-3-like isoform X2 [Symsagittifera roscoffensis]|uniref:voltage-dependent calcium channel subunit alpha-2/delta-3-like isoform X2 n=1 Tax=Symsagittifera roscoffensis TaxID=84072 RepID=UPI00307B7546
MSSQFQILAIISLISMNIGGVRTSNTKDHEISKDRVRQLGEKLHEYFGRTLGENLGAEKLEDIVRQKSPRISKIDGEKMVLEFATEMQKMLSAKITAIENIANQTEDANMKHKYDRDLEFDYYNANFLNKYRLVTDEWGNQSMELRPDSKEMVFISSEQFQDTSINWTHSTLQVPVSIFKRDPDVVNGIYFTESLNRVFEENHKKDPTLTWQYFASSTGFFRNYPGVDWGVGEGDVDVYDARERSWYLQASHSPKDVVILIDSSGSMTGSREFVASNAVQTIIETLLDDDFFNILTFAEETNYLEECFNGHLVQANSDNKQIMKKKLDEKTMRGGSIGIANFQTALTTAFQLLKNKSQDGSQCNQAIMLLTDGAVDNFEEIFEEYNSERRIRVFTYIIGRDVKNSDPVKWMACNNKGWYAQIATLADVKINVMQYIHVLSRPMVIAKSKRYKWTNVYMDVGSQGLRLMTTVSTPAFDNVVERANEGILLGVAGVDVPINEMNTYTPSYRLGLNGYTFSITNNGYIMNHPELRPKYMNHKGEELDKPNYNSVDMSEVELQDRRHNYTYDNGTKVWVEDGLRSRMVDGQVGGYTLDDVIYRMSAWDRIDIRDMNYYFTPLEKTPFRLAIAIQREFGMYNFSLKSGMGRRDDPKKIKAMESKNIRLDKCNAPQPNGPKHDTLSVCAVYCMMDEGTSKEMSQMQAVINEIKDPMLNRELKVICNTNAVNAVIEDAVVTQEFADSFWRDREGDHVAMGVQEVFVGTRSGFLRFKQIGQKKTDAVYSKILKVLAEEESTLGAEFFQMASSIYSLMNRSGALVIWIPTTRDIYDVAKKHQGVMAVARLVFAGHTPDKQNPYSSAQSGGGSYNSNNFYNDRDQYSNSWNRDSKSDTQFESQESQSLFDPSKFNYYNKRQRRSSSSSSSEGNNASKSTEGEGLRKKIEEIFLDSSLYEKFDNGTYPEIDPSSFYYPEHEKNPRALVGAVGMYVSLDSVEQKFNDILRESGREQSSRQTASTFAQQKSCLESDLIDCYILDHNAFVVMSENKDHFSKFFGEIDGNAMRSLESMNLFKNYTLLDQQGMCEFTISNEKAAANRPSFALFRASARIVELTFGLISQLVFVNIFQLSLPLMDIWNRAMVLAEDFKENLEEAVDSVVSPTLNEPTIVIEKKGYEPCDMEKLVYLRNFEAVDGHTKYECKELNAQLKCFRKMLYTDIRETNLVLLTVINSPNCQCNREPFSLRKTRKEYASNLEKCDRMLFQKHRSRPPNCENFHEKEDSKHCGRSFRTEVTSLLLWISIVFHCIRHSL